MQSQQLEESTRDMGISDNMLHAVIPGVTCAQEVLSFLGSPGARFIGDKTTELQHLGNYMSMPRDYRAVSHGPRNGCASVFHVLRGVPLMVIRFIELEQCKGEEVALQPRRSQIK